MKITVAALQLAARPGDVDTNLARLEAVLAALGPGTDLAVAPELYTTGYDLELLATEGVRLGEGANGPSVARLVAMAGRAGLTLVAGFLEAEDGELFDSVVAVGAGTEPTVYRKTHLYPPEQPLFAPGSELVVADSGAARLGMMICFEHAFPEIATTLALAGSDLLVIPSAVPRGYEHVLSLRTRARAQDNQLFAIGANMSAPFCGRSLIVDPRGNVVAEAGTGEETIVAVLDLEAAAAERAREPALDLRRPELYR